MPAPELVLPDHPLFKHTTVEFVRGDGVLEANVLHKFIDDGNIPVDNNWVSDLAGQLNEKFIENGRRGTGQIEAIDLVFIPDSDLFQLRNGAHRHAANLLRGIGFDWATIDLNGTWESVWDGRLAASQRPELYLARFREIVTEAWRFATCSNLVSAQEALAVFLGRDQSEIIARLTDSQQLMVMDEMHRKLTHWHHDPEEIYLNLKRSEGVAAPILRQARVNRRGKKAAVINAGAVQILNDQLPGKEELQVLAAETKAEQGLKNPDFELLTLALKRAGSLEEAQQLVESGRWKDQQSDSSYERREQEIADQTRFVTDQYSAFYRDEVRRRRLTVLPNPADPLSIIPTTDRGTAIVELKNRDNWIERPSGPFKLVEDERQILPLDLTRFAELQNSPLDRHRMAVHFLQLLGCPYNLTNIDRFYLTTPDGLEAGKKTIIVGHPDRPIIVRALGTPASHGMNIEKMWIIFSHLYPDAAKRQLEPDDRVKESQVITSREPERRAQLETRTRTYPSPRRLVITPRQQELVEVDLDGNPVQKNAPEETPRPKPAEKPAWDPNSIAHYPELTRKDLQPHNRYIHKTTGRVVVIDLLPGIEVHYSNAEDRGGAKVVHRDDFLEEFVRDF